MIGTVTGAIGLIVGIVMVATGAGFYFTHSSTIDDLSCACSAPKSAALRLQWLRTKRVMAAERLLEGSDLSVEQTAERTDVGSALNFRQHFLRSVGTTPQSYCNRPEFDLGWPRRSPVQLARSSVS